MTLQDNRTTVSSLCRKSAPKTSDINRGRGRAEIFAGHTFCLLQQRRLQTPERALPRVKMEGPVLGYWWKMCKLALVPVI